MSPHHEKCHCCGQKLRKLNPHHMCRSKVWMLLLLNEAMKSGKPWLRLRQTDFIDIAGKRYKLPYVSLTQATRLRWFGLAEEQDVRSGTYRITDAGVRFLKGIESVPRKIYCRDGAVVRESNERVFLDDIKDVILTKQYWDNYAKEQVAA